MSKPLRRAATIRITVEELADLIGLAPSVEVRGVMGLPITSVGPSPIDLIVVHDALPTVAELDLPYRYDLAEVPAVILRSDSDAEEPTC